MTTYTDLKARLGRMEAITMPGQPFTLETVRPWLEKNAEIRREALAAIEELEARATPAAMLDAYDDFMGGGVCSDLAQMVRNAAVFAAAAYENHGGGGEGTHAMARAFLLAAMDPTHHELDYLRADPASGEAARSAAKKLRAITETPNDRA